jgi:hypothetical protein
MALVENLSGFFNDFGVSATVGGVSLRGIFDNQFGNAFGLASGSNPMLIVRASDVPTATAGTTVAIGAASYVVTDVELDGTGLCVLRLDSAS